MVPVMGLHGFTGSDGGIMELDLDRILEATKRGQWSLGDINWSAPVEGTEKLSVKEVRDIALNLLMVSGLERLAANIFELNSVHVKNPVARRIYRLFVEDEIRHAEAEERMAARLGYGPADLSPGLRTVFKRAGDSWLKYGRPFYAMTAPVIVFFELALDSMLIRDLKARLQDPVQAEVFKNIDTDEARHLAMDYWLLDEIGKGNEKASLGINPGILRLALGTALPLPSAITQFVRDTESMMTDQTPVLFKLWLSRVRAIPEKAPHAAKVPVFNGALKIINATVRYSGAEPDWSTAEQTLQTTGSGPLPA